MIAKLIIHGEDRNDTIKKTLHSLEHFIVMGVKTTIPFCKAVLHNDVFCKGDFNTSFIETELKSLIYQEEHEELIAALLAVSSYNHDNDFVGDGDDTPEGQMDPWVLQKRIRHL